MVTNRSVCSQSLLVALAVFALVVFVQPRTAGAQIPNLVNSYEFSGNFEDSLGNGEDLVQDNVETSTFGGGTWTWTAVTDPGAGLIMDTVNTISDNYSISLKFMFTEVGPSWKKIISFKDQSDDNGFYFYGGQLQFYPYGDLGPTVFPANTMIELVVTRDSVTNTVAAYVVDDGGTLTLEIEVEDTLLSTVPQVVGGKSRFRFFQDDTDTNGEWTPGGTVDWIRVWDGPLDPGQIPVELMSFTAE
jgi:hypothetical protein